MARVRIACLQLSAFDLARAEEGLQHTLAAVDRAARERPQLMVLPEVTYPAYFLRSPEEYRAAALRDAGELIELFGGRAKAHGCYIAIGLALPNGDGALGNAACLFAPDGTLAGRYDKSFLWHFDRRWFTPGERYPVFDTPFGRLGMLVCADGRLPEISRCLAVAGARLLVDCTAWVSWGREPAALSSPQPEYMMPVRAFENGVWVAAAGKVGLEDGTIVYCGRSCVVAPDGRVVAGAGSEGDETLVCEIDLAEAAGPPVERRPDLYGPLVTPTADLPPAEEAMQPAAESRRVAAVAAETPATAADALELSRRFVASLRRQNTDLTLLPDFSPAVRASETLDGLRALSAAEGGLLAVGLREEAAGAAYKTLYLLDGGRVLASHRATHLLPREWDAGLAAGDEPPPVVQTSVGRVGLLIGSEGLVPEVARCLTLAGAEALVWAASTVAGPWPALARCRADENRVYVAVSGAPGSGALVVDPAGRLAASTLMGREMACAAQVNRALSHWKDMSPGSNVVLHRQPETYGILVRQKGPPMG